VVKTYPFHYDLPKVRDADLELHVQAGMLGRLDAGFPLCRYTAIPNGQKRTRWQAQQALAEGMQAGFPDLIIMAPEPLEWDPPLRGLVAFIEVKAEGCLTDLQEGWLTALTGMGFHCGVFRSQITLAAKLKEWGFPHRERD
jgi:hypothetical protein